MNPKKIALLFSRYQSDRNRYKSPYGYQWACDEANCYIQMKDYPKAQELCEKNCIGNWHKPKFWWLSGQTQFLIDTWVLSGRWDLFKRTKEEFEKFVKEVPINKWTTFGFYACAVMALLETEGKGTGDWSKMPDSWHKNKLIKAFDQVLEAIIERDQPSYDIGLTALLKVHEGMEKFGMLRETGEGFVCMPAMTLVYVGRKFGLEPTIKNDYMPLEYLDYLEKSNEKPGN